MARFLKPLVRSGGYYPSRRWTPLVYPGGYTTANGGEEPAPPPVEKTVIGNPIHILDALAKPVQALSIALEPIQDLHGYDNPWPAGGGKNKFSFANISSKNIYRANVQQMGTDPNAFYMAGAAGTSDTMQLSVASWAFVCTWIDYQTTAETTITVSCKVKNYSADCNGFIRIRYGDTQNRDSSTAAATTFFNDVGQYQVTATATIPSGKYVGLEFSPAAKESDFALTQYTEVTEYQLELGSTATAFAPYSNICPISGCTGANIHVSPTTDAQDGTTYSITFPSAAGTVYGGTLDVTTGKLCTEWVMYDGGDLDWTKVSNSNYRNFYAKALDVLLYANNVSSILSSAYKSTNNNASTATDDFYVWATALQPNNTISVKDTAKESMTAAEFKAAMAGVQFLCMLKTPIEHILTPTEVKTILGENNIWADTGDVTVTYLADGNASDAEALNILLGGRYVNNHGEDEPTDREALDIVLGGKK